MRKLLRSLVRNESGQGVLLTVLILLMLGALITVPLLNLMGTGLEAGRGVEERTDEFYAADAGVEDALYKLLNNIEPPSNPYTLPNINGKQVQVSLPSEKATMIRFFKEIGVLDPHGQGDYHKNTPHAVWLVVYSPIETGPGVYGEYRITVYYNDSPPRDVLSAGFWVYGYNGNTDPIPYNSTGEDAFVWIDLDLDGVNETGEWIPTDGPLIDGFVPPNGTGVFREAQWGGKAFIWEWAIHDGPTFGEKIGVHCRTQRFLLEPAMTVDEFPPNVAWIETKTDDISISWFGMIGINYIISTATDPYTLTHTTVESYVFRQASGNIFVMTYETSV